MTSGSCSGWLTLGSLVRFRGFARRVVRACRTLVSEMADVGLIVLILVFVAKVLRNP
ncbi:hypothetical protein GCM10009642_63450 [Nocardiopsis metallicus]